MAMIRSVKPFMIAFNLLSNLRERFACGAPSRHMGPMRPMGSPRADPRDPHCRLRADLGAGDNMCAWDGYRGGARIPTQ